MGGKGEIDVGGHGGTEPRDDYVHMSDILPDDFPVFPDGAGEVEEYFTSGGSQNVFSDGTYWYFQSSFDFDTFPQSDGFFGFSNDVVYADRVNTLVEVVTLGDYFLDFVNDRVYSYRNPGDPPSTQPPTGMFVHMCERQITIFGAGPLTDFDYEVITELYPSQAPGIDPNPSNQFYMLNEIVRWDNGNLLAHTGTSIFSRIYGTWEYDSFWGIMHSSDNGLSWAFPTFTGSIPYPHLGQMQPFKSSLSFSDKVFEWAPDNTIVLARLYDRDWDVPGPTSFLVQLWWSIDGGANFAQGWNIQDWTSGYPVGRWDGNTGMTRDTLALDQRYRVDFIEYAGEHACFLYEASGQPAEFWSVTRTGFGGFVPVNLWQMTGGQQAGQCKSVLVGNDNHMLFTTAAGELWKSINHAVPVKLVDDWRDLYPAGPEKDAASGIIRPYTFTPETDDIWMWNNSSGSRAGHLWHSSDAGVTWTWLTDPNNGGVAPAAGHPNDGIQTGPGRGLIRLSDNKFLSMVSHWPRDVSMWLSEDGGVTWSKIVTYPGFGFGTPGAGWPYPDPVTSTKFTAAEGNNGGLGSFSNFIPEGIRSGNETEFYLWCGAAAVELAPTYVAQDEVMRLMRIHLFPSDAVSNDICSEAGFIIRAPHVNDLRIKLSQLNANVRTGGTNKVNFGIDFKAMTAADIPVTADKDHIRAPHYQALVTEFTGVAGQVGTSPGGEWYTEDIDLGDFLTLIVPPVAGDPPSIRTLIAMRKIIQALYTNGWFCACYSYCPCQSDIQIDISGGKK